MKYLLGLLLVILLVSPVSARIRRTQTLTPQKVWTVHTGSYSLDRNNLTQAEVDAQVTAIVNSMPNANYIAIGTYLDYWQQIQMWSDSIHARGRHVFFRSAGFNAWQQRNGVTYVMTPNDHRVWVSTFIRLHPTVFSSGDIFEAVPDEPEGGTYWYNTYGQGGVGANQQAKDEFNSFIQGSITDVNNVFTEMNIIGVGTGYVFTNPSAARDVISDQTASMLSAVGTDDYPEVTCLTSTDCANAMQAELDDWIVPSHPTVPKHLTIGPSVYRQFSQTLQKSTYTKELDVIKNTVINLNGITIWQGGANDNPKSRVLDYSNGNWSPRQATSTINSFFGSN